MLVSAAEGSWLMDAPIASSRLLSGRLRLDTIAAGVLAAVLGALTAALSGSGQLEIGLWALADGLGAAAITAFAAAEQASTTASADGSDEGPGTTDAGDDQPAPRSRPAPE